MKSLILVCLFFGSALSAKPAFADEACLAQDDSNLGAFLCLQEDLQKEETKMQQLLLSLRSTFSNISNNSNLQNQLSMAQIAFNSKVASTCRSENSRRQNGSGEQVDILICKVEMTKDRVVELKNMLSYALSLRK